MNFKINEIHKVNYFYYAEQEQVNVEVSSVICVSKFNVLKACKGTTLIAPHDNCTQSLFTVKAKDETCIQYNLANDNDYAKIQIWKLTNLIVASGGILRISQGKGRTLRFENKESSLIKDLKIQSNNVWVFIPKEVLNIYTIEILKMQKAKNTSCPIINLNLFFYKKTSSFGYISDTHDKCPICLNLFEYNENVFYPHDEMHPVCTDCTFELIQSGDNRCPLCRADIIVK